MKTLLHTIVFVTFIGFSQAETNSKQNSELSNLNDSKTLSEVFNQTNLSSEHLGNMLSPGGQAMEVTTSLAILKNSKDVDDGK